MLNDWQQEKYGQWMIMPCKGNGDSAMLPLMSKCDKDWTSSIKERLERVPLKEFHRNVTKIERVSSKKD